MECNRQNFLSFWTFFCLLPPYGPKKSKFWKDENNTWRYYHFPDVYQKWQSYNVWFLRYGVWQTELFVILDHFLPFTPIWTQKIKILKKWKKKPWRYYHFPNMCHNWQSYDVWFLRLLRVTDRIFLSFWAVFLPFYPPT